MEEAWDSPILDKIPSLATQRWPNIASFLIMFNHPLGFSSHVFWPMAHRWPFLVYSIDSSVSWPKSPRFNPAWTENVWWPPDKHHPEIHLKHPKWWVFKTKWFMANLCNSKVYPLVSSNMASWKIPELNGGFNGKITDIDGPCSRTPCLIVVPTSCKFQSVHLPSFLHLAGRECGVSAWIIRRCQRWVAAAVLSSMMSLIAFVASGPKNLLFTPGMGPSMMSYHTCSYLNPI